MLPAPMQETTAPDPNYRTLVFATALCCLTYELVLSRLVDFHLGADNAYLALPIAFLGLALGSLYVHFRPSTLANFRLSRSLAWLIGLCVGGLLFAFVFFSWVMPVTSTMGISDQLDYLSKKTAVFVVVMVAPFFSFGRLLTSIYQLRRDEIGSIYAADLLGAALACGLTPIAFAFGGLPTVIIILILLSFVPLVIATSDSRKRWIVIGAALVVAIASERLVDYSDRTVSYEQWGTKSKYEEVERAWNEHSRVALVRKLPNKKGGKPSYNIIHDNSRSNVHVWGYHDRDRKPQSLSAIEAPFVMGRKPKNILVMFAGTGAEMVVFDELARRKANITGVEINGLVKKLGMEAKAIASYRLAEFLNLDRIDLVIDEGRHFLTTRPEGTKYDLIYLGSNAATTAVTGHSTKYLDTVEAYHAYLDLLAPGGLMVFDHQPLAMRIQNLRVVFEQRGIDNFAERVVVIDEPSRGDDDMILAPDGFTDAELDAMVAFAKQKGKNKRRIHYMKARGHRNSRYVEAVEGPIERVFVDDRPFMKELEVENYELLPPERKTISWYINWIKITTVIILSGIAVLFIAVAALKRDARAPVPVLLYLLLTGFCFMLCEVAIMAKLELFLTQPLLSMAAVLSLFLLTSGVGSAVYPRLGKLHDTRLLAGLAVVAVVFVMFTLDWMVGHLLHLPVALKLVLATVITAPLGVVLGLFYPHVVSCLVDQKREQTVSISYGLSTLSSVVGSAYALAAMINLGFNALLKQAAIGYVALLVFALIYQLVGGKWLSRAVAK
jgi:spermidine synthase